MKKIVRGKEVHRRIIHQGNSLMMTIPPVIIEQLAIRAGDPIKIETDDQDRMIVEKIRPRRDLKHLGGDTCQH